MRTWISSLVRDRVLEIALALAFGYVVATLASEIADVAIGVLAQHLGDDPYGDDGTVLGLLQLFSSAPYLLNFSVGGTDIVYGEALASTLTLGLVALIGLAVIRRRDRELGACAFCASRIPRESTHCAYCGSSLEPGDE